MHKFLGVIHIVNQKAAATARVLVEAAASDVKRFHSGFQHVYFRGDKAAGNVRALAIAPELKDRLRLVMIGDGPLRAQSQTLLEQAGCAELVWLPGERNDVAEILRGLDCFVLPSLAEGVSNTILEAMATGLSVIATDVGGNSELVDDGRSGILVHAGDSEAIAQSIVSYANDRDKARRAGQAGRAAVERQFSMAAMVQQYQGLYDRLLNTN